MQARESQINERQNTTTAIKNKVTHKAYFPIFLFIFFFFIIIFKRFYYIFTYFSTIQWLLKYYFSIKKFIASLAFEIG